MKIFIGCSSSSNLDSNFYNDMDYLLTTIFGTGYDLVFGASNHGLMGLAHDKAKEYGRKIYGICPKIYKDDFKKIDCSEEIITNTVGERTESLIQNSDILLFLPGGIGTVYELFSAIETKRSHEHNKEILILNYKGYYDELLKMLSKGYFENCVKFNDLNNYRVYSSIEELISYLKVQDYLSKNNDYKRLVKK